jgi:hypothetical protein
MGICHAVFTAAVRTAIAMAVLAVPAWSSGWAEAQDDASVNAAIDAALHPALAAYVTCTMQWANTFAGRTDQTLDDTADAVMAKCRPQSQDILVTLMTPPFHAAPETAAIYMKRTHDAVRRQVIDQITDARAKLAP